MADDDAEQKRAALRLLSQNPQTSVAQDQMRQQQQRMDLSQLRPQVRDAVAQQQQRAEQLFASAIPEFSRTLRTSTDPNIIEIRNELKKRGMNAALELV